VINSDTVDVARRAKRNIWQESVKHFTMVMVSPEELASKDFSRLSGVKEFWDRIFALGVDEAHLLSFLGALFQTVYHRIGFLCERLPLRCGRRTRLLALSATLREGVPMDCICFAASGRISFRSVFKCASRHSNYLSEYAIWVEEPGYMENKVLMKMWDKSV
jgi:superfamily II DNA helicase RecQ